MRSLLTLAVALAATALPAQEPPQAPPVQYKEPPQAPPIEHREPPQAPPVEDEKPPPVSRSGPQSYTHVLARVLVGETVGVAFHAPIREGYESVDVKTIPSGVGPGYYRCYRDSAGLPRMVMVESYPPPRAVQPAVRGGRPGEHSHRCGNCGTEFWHDGRTNAAHRCPNCGAGPWTVIERFGFVLPTQPTSGCFGAG